MHLRLLTYNVQARPMGLDIVDNEQRATEIADRILNSQLDFDVVCLNEVFDEDAREIFAKALTSKYPHHFLKMGGDEFMTSLTASESAGLVALGFIGAVITLGIGNLATTEDSGLMILSKHPFDTAPQNIDGMIKQLPATKWAPYKSHSGSDSLANKGAMSVRLALPDGRKFVVTATHTQADSEDDGENAEIRAAQLSDAWNNTLSLTDETNAKHDFVIMGDLNINGMISTLSAIDATKEWKSYFQNPSAALNFWDAWAFEQSPGLGVPSGAISVNPTDTGVTAPIPNGDRRYDYYLMRPGTGKLTLQHMFVDYDLAQTSDSVPFLSDHRPLVLDLASVDRSRSSPPRAEPITCTETTPFFSISDGLFPGQIQWFVIMNDGTYDIAISNAKFQLFSIDNLSFPLVPYKVYTGGERRIEKMILPSAPIFVKVFFEDRYLSGNFSMSLNKYLGTSLDDAIEMPSKKNVSARHKMGTITSNFTCTLGDGSKLEDCIYFAFDVLESKNAAQRIQASVSVKNGNARVRLLVLERIGDSTASVLANSSFARGVAKVSLKSSGGRYFLAVQRENGTGYPQSEFEVNWESDVSIAYGPTAYRTYRNKEGNNPLAAFPPPREPMIKCIEETSSFLGIGDDDIFLEISVDGKQYLKISNDQIRDFTDDVARSLDPWLSSPVIYVEQINFRVVEEDVVDDDDGTITFSSIGKYGRASNGLATQVTERTSFSGGIYDVTLTLA
jgi:endonuclease/exonuclease/phosphatase family metal-dependent hydrolase